MPSRAGAMVAALGIALAGAGYLRLEAAPPHSPISQGSRQVVAGSDVRSDVAAASSSAPRRALLDQYCVPCHNQKLKTAGLLFDAMNIEQVGDHAETWEKVVQKLRGGMMPPIGRPRPDQRAIDEMVVWLETELDRGAGSVPSPIPVHRLNRAEYANAVRDLLAIDVDGEALLPPDAAHHGFDNIAGNLTVSSALFERYLLAARRVSRLAVGDPTIGPAFESKTYSVPVNLSQNDRMSEDLPFGSRGGVAVRHRFALDGEYVLQVRLRKSVYGYVRNLDEPHQLDVRVDGQRVAAFTVGGDHGKPAPVSYGANIIPVAGSQYPSPEWEAYVTSADRDLQVRIPVHAGTRTVGVSFENRSWDREGVLQPFLTEYAATITEMTDLSPGPEGPAVESIAIEGPYDAAGPGETLSRRKIFVCRPAGTADEVPCARKILSNLARQAYRRPVTEREVVALLTAYRTGRSTGDFDAGLRWAVEAILVSPGFLFRVERAPVNTALGTPYRISDLGLASRLSFFLWSSIPDHELLDLAIAGQLREPAILAQQVRRLLADARSKALVDNFASQWLSLRSVRGQKPDPNLFPDFDDNLRDAFHRETELFVWSQLRRDRSVVELLSANYTFVNERLARHYGIPGVSGSRFRRVALPDASRGGLLGQGSVLMVTSYGNRTSPVLRAKWLLDNILGTPPPPPPADVPGLPEKGEDGEPRSVRERLAQHRKNPVCASCHAPMDPLGFALENFDAIGQWRATDAGTRIDASGVLADGTTINGPVELRRLLLQRREQFVRTVTEKLLTYGLGRGLDYSDRPIIRRVAREAATHDYSWSSLILGIVNSTAFQMSRAKP